MPVEKYHNSREAEQRDMRDMSIDTASFEDAAKKFGKYYEITVEEEK